VSDEPLERLAAAASARGWPAAGLEPLAAYLRAVLSWRGRVNLTGARDLGEAVDTLAVSAFAVTHAWDRDAPPQLAVDLGTGNGLPGVAVALAWPTAEVLLVERRRRKAEAVAACLAEAGIGNAVAVAAEGRDLARVRPDVLGRVDLVTVRAVGTAAQAVEIAAPWLAPGGRIAHFKGASLSAEEEAAGAKAAARAGLRALPVRRYEDPWGPARLLCHER
jgi:16S rRNA (guanine527-N7)-methyltransferase